MGDGAEMYCPLFWDGGMSYLKKLICVLLSVVLAVCPVLPVFAVTGEEVMESFQGADAATIIKYLFTQMGAVVFGNLDDVIKNNETLVGYYNNGLPYYKDSGGNINIKSDTVNNIYNAIKDTSTALDGYYLVTPVRTFEDFFFSLPTGFPVSAYSGFKKHIDTRNGFVVASLTPNYIYTPGSYMKANVSGYACMDGNYVSFCDFDLNYIGYQHYLMNGSSLIPMNGERFTLEQFKTLYMGDGATKVFYSIPDLRKYLGGYNNVYYRSKYYTYNTNHDNRVTFQGDKILTQNWDTINNNIINNIRNEIVGKDLNEEDRQTAIDDIFEKILESLGDIGGTVEDIGTTTNSWLKKIYTKMDAILAVIENPTKILDLVSTKADMLGKKIQGVIDAVKDINVSGGGGLGNVVGSALGTLLGNLLDKIIGGGQEAVTDAVQELATTFAPMVDVSKTKFPFSIPWDFQKIIVLLAAEPEIPILKIPFSLPNYGFKQDIDIDLTPFEDISKITRAFFTVMFVISLMNITIKLMGKGGE